MGHVVFSDRYQSADGTRHYLTANLVVESGGVVLQTALWRHGQPVLDERKRFADGAGASLFARATEAAFELRDAWLADLRGKEGIR